MVLTNPLKGVQKQANKGSFTNNPKKINNILFFDLIKNMETVFIQCDEKFCKIKNVVSRKSSFLHELLYILSND